MDTLEFLSEQMLAAAPRVKKWNFFLLQRRRSWNEAALHPVETFWLALKAAFYCPVCTAHASGGKQASDRQTDWWFLQGDSQQTDSRVGIPGDTLHSSAHLDCLHAAGRTHFPEPHWAVVTACTQTRTHQIMHRLANTDTQAVFECRVSGTGSRKLSHRWSRYTKSI